jgi:hypothetical protein
MPLPPTGFSETAPLDGSTTHLELHSQATRLVEIVPQSTACWVQHATVTRTIPSPIDMEAVQRSKVKLTIGCRYRWSIQDKSPNYPQHCHDPRFPR